MTTNNRNKLELVKRMIRGIGRVRPSRDKNSEDAMKLALFYRTALSRPL